MLGVHYFYWHISRTHTATRNYFFFIAQKLKKLDRVIRSIFDFSFWRESKITSSISYGNFSKD